MTIRLSILDRSGDTKLTWDAADPAQCANARRTVAALKEAGYVFFLTDGSPADAVAAGGGTLLVRRMDADEVAPEPGPVAAGAEPDPEPAAPVKRRGRPPKAEAADRNIVAARPLRGG